MVQNSPKEGAPLPAYVIAMMSIHDPETYKKYTDLTPPIVKKYGGKFLTRGERVTTIEGEEYTARMVSWSFPPKIMFGHGSLTQTILRQKSGGRQRPRLAFLSSKAG
jgi:hypothetical protein